MEKFLLRVQNLTEKESGSSVPSKQPEKSRLHRITKGDLFSPDFYFDRDADLSNSSPRNDSAKFQRSAICDRATSTIRPGLRPHRNNQWVHVPDTSVSYPQVQSTRVSQVDKWVPIVPASQSFDLEDRVSQKPSAQSESFFNSRASVGNERFSTSSSYAMLSRISVESANEPSSTSKVKTLSEFGHLTATFSPCRCTAKDEDGRMSKKPSERNLTESFNGVTTTTQDHFKTVHLDSMSIDSWFVGRRVSKEFLPAIKEEPAEGEEDPEL